MKEKLIALQEKIDARVIRERAILFICLLTVIFLIWTFLVQSFVDKKSKEIQEELASSVQQKASLQTQLVAIGQAMMNDPVRVKTNQVNQIQTDIGSVDTQLQSASQSLIQANLLPVALQEVLQKTAQLKLLEVKTFPARALAISQVKAVVQRSAPSDAKAKDAAAAKNDTEEVAGVYEHAVQIKVAGNYFQVLNFLKSLEQLPWRFYWQRLDYSVKEYPNAEVKIRVYTISLDEGLLGV